MLHSVALDIKHIYVGSRGGLEPPKPPLWTRPCCGIQHSAATGRPQIGLKHIYNIENSGCTCARYVAKGWLCEHSYSCGIYLWHIIIYFDHLFGVHHHSVGSSARRWITILPCLRINSKPSLVFPPKHINSGQKY